MIVRPSRDQVFTVRTSWHSVGGVTALSPENFVEHFGMLFQRSAFRLELLDHYIAPNEHEPFRRFLAGLPNETSWREPWKAFVRNAKASNKTMARVHVITEPTTDYVRFELTCTYPANVEAGEDVRVLPRTHPAARDLPNHDYWLLDSRHVAIMNYEAGNWINVDLVDDPRMATRHCRWRDIALQHSIPLAVYLSQINHDLSGRRTA